MENTGGLYIFGDEDKHNKNNQNEVTSYMTFHHARGQATTWEA